VNNWVSLAFAYYYAGHAAKAVTVMDSARLLFDVPHIYFMKARIFVHLGEYQKVIDNLSKLFVMNPGSRDIPRLQAWLAIAYYQLGNSTEAEKLLEQLKIVSKTSQAGSPAFHVSLIYAQTGRTELALQWLETAYSNHEVEMHWLGADRLFNPLRSSKRFQTIVDKIKQAK
jgi:tetratricopeptide (TPR) repeat protein